MLQRPKVHNIPMDLFIQSGSNVIINMSVFVGNNAVCQWCGYYADFVTTNSLSHTTRELRIAEGSGGAISLYGSNVEIKESVFLYNRAKCKGGAMYAGSTTRPVIILMSQFIKNSAGDCGVLYAGTSLNIMQTDFYDNNAINNGGAICTFVSKISIHIQESKFHNNSADVGGAFSVIGRAFSVLY